MESIFIYRHKQFINFDLRLSIIAILFLLSEPALGQFEKRIEINPALGIGYMGSKVIEYPLDYKVEMGQQPLLSAKFNIWYNLNRKVSLGINALVSGTFDNGSDYTEDASVLADNLNLENSHYYGVYSFGLGAKYYVITKKKFRVYGRGNVGYNLHEVGLYPYAVVNSGNEPFTNQLYLGYVESTYYKSLGVELGLGFKTYFSRSFGVGFDAYVFDNGFCQGAIIHGGFFFDLFSY